MMNRTGRYLVATAAASIGAAGFCATAQAQAFYLQEQSVRGQGRAFSGEAADTGSASIWWNPAAIASIRGGDASIGVSAILPRGNVVDLNTIIVRPGTAGEPVGGNPRAHNPINNGVLPSGAVAWGNGKIAFGVAVASPYSFTTNYEADSWARYTADKTRLRTIDIQPTIAYTLGDHVNVGWGLNIEHVDATLSNFMPNLSSALPDGHQSLKGDGWDVGWSVGAQVHYGIVSVGASFKSSIKHTLSGTVTTTGLLGPLEGENGELSTQATFRTPWQLIGSVRVRATPQLTLNGQVVRFGWSEFDAIRLGAPLNVGIPELYRNTWTYAGGVDYQVNPEWTVRAGVQYGQTPTYSSARDARVPDSNRWNFSAGTSYALNKAITIDAAASYISFKDAPINRTTAAYAGTPAQTPILVDGRLEDASALVFSLGGRAQF